MPSVPHLALLATTALFAAASTAVAQMDLPVDRVPVDRIASYPPGTFLESLAITAAGDLLIVEHTNHDVLQVTTAGDETLLSHLPDGAAGIALDIDGTAIITSGYQDDAGYVTVLGPTGAPDRVIPVPGSRFLNGATLLRPGVFLAADSITGQVFQVDIRTGTAAVWLADDSLAPNPDLAHIPGANGLKVFDGAVYVTNSGRAQIVRVPITDALGADRPEIWLSGLVLDDIAFAADGTLYGTTHIFDSVVRIERDGSATTIATGEDGVTGSTAVMFGRTPADAETLYTIGDGGVFQPPPGGLVEAEIVGLSVGERGLTPLEALDHLAYPGQVAPVDAYLVRCETAPGTQDLRPTVGPGYVRYLETQIDRIAFAGQVFEGDATDPTARLYIVTAADAEAARAMMEGSPYYTAGLYAGCTVARFSGVIGTLLGGVAWPDDLSQSAPMAQ